MICKPDALAQGKGIFLTNELERIRDLPTCDQTVVQEYLSDPMLIDGLKFDMRVYVLLTSCEPLRIFVHKEGLVRFTTQAYQKVGPLSCQKDLDQSLVHLTNYSLQKDALEFRQPESS